MFVEGEKTVCGARLVFQPVLRKENSCRRLHPQPLNLPGVQDPTQTTYEGSPIGLLSLEELITVSPCATCRDDVNNLGVAFDIEQLDPGNAAVPSIFKFQDET